MQNLAWGSRYHKLTPGVIKSGMRNLLGAMPDGSRAKQKLLRTFLTLSPDIESLYLDNFAVYSRKTQPQLLTPETRERIGPNVDPYRVIREMMELTDAESLLDRLLYSDIKTYLHELLMKQDQMSMAASIESRVPFLDHKLVEFTASLPERLKLRGSTTKYILREAMRDVLPPEILTRGKMGFPVPIGAWFRAQFRGIIDELVLSPRALERGLFDAEAIRTLVSRHTAGEDHAERLWSLVNLEIWHRVVVEGEPATSLQLL